MLVSFTGAQCTGKTTLLKKMRDNLYGKEFAKDPNDNVYRSKWRFVDEVTRKVGRMGHKINEAGGNITQLYILKEHLENHFTGHNTILDRCIVDGYVYTKYLMEEGSVDRWVLNYARDLLSFLGKELDIIFYTEPDDIPIEDDGGRSIDAGFRDGIIKIYEDIMTDSSSISGAHPWRDKIIRLTGNVDERMKTIQDTLDNNEQ